jgi:hypothetical protein
MFLAAKTDNPERETLAQILRDESVFVLVRDFNAAQMRLTLVKPVLGVLFFSLVVRLRFVAALFWACKGKSGSHASNHATL